MLLGIALLASILHAAEFKPAGVTVSGPGSVGVLSMSGGEIKIGLTPQEVKALEKATAKEIIALLKPALNRINAQIAHIAGVAREDKIALGVAEAFLATIKGKKIPTSEWSVEFGEATRNYLRLGASIEATPVTSERIRALVSSADAARKQGKFGEADAALSEAAEIATQDAQRIQQQALASSRQAASLHVSRAKLAFIRLERSQGASLLEKAFDLRKGDISNETLQWLFDAGEAWLIDGQSASAMRAYVMAQVAATSGLVSDPHNAEWLHDLSISYERIGFVQAAQGDSAVALNSFQAGLAIQERLATSDPSNTEWQRDLSISYERIGDVQAAQGDSAAALKSFQSDLAIAERLVARDPRNIQWQRDLSISYLKIGDMQVAQSDFVSALKSFQAGLGIRERLAASNPRNSEGQRDLSISYNKIGDVFAAQGDTTAALNSFQIGLAIAELLSSVDPRNTQWQRDLSISYNKIGDVQAAQGQPALALKSFQEGLTIRERLTAGDPRNTQWQRDLSISYNKIGDAQVVQRHFAAALGSFQAALAIAERLAAGDLHNTEWQRDLSASYDRIGIVQNAQGHSAAALSSFQTSMAIAERLAASDPRNPQWQRDVAVTCWRLASLGETLGSTQTQRAILKKGLDILIVQRDRGQTPARNVGWIKIFEDALQKLK